ncbi:Tetratricopeptide repeat-containing domain [Macleaya cordata]|uniref:Tetratricopeptide repeat-containing domain n=1 Tax=Macleaya cordata TaxID=56857 RepID=A0A200R8V5_MACCD|nr:Tetratricopeptide repeat-containing domain [Macleaya cordata]
MDAMAEASTPIADFEMDDVEEEDEYEEEEEEEGGDEGEEDIEDGEYTLRFDGEMNPLDFTEDDAFGVQPYQQFERLEYEALAERKRKALSNRPRDGPAKKSRQEDDFITKMDEMLEGMNFGMRRKSRKPKKRGRRKGSKNKLSPEVTRKLGEANIYYAKRQYEEAIFVLKEVIMLAPNLSESYHTLGLVYEEIGDKKKAMNFYMLAAHLAPKEHPSLWKRLVSLSIEQGNTGQATYCLSKAIRADPEDMGLRFDRALLYIELGDYQKAAESYDHIVGFCPENLEARKMAAKMYQKCGQVEHSIRILEDYIKERTTDADWSVIDLLAAINMESNAYTKALQQIEHARSVCCSEEQLPLYLTVKAGICHVHLGNIEEAEIFFRDLRMKHAGDNADLIIMVGNTFMNLEHYDFALKYYFLLEGIDGHDNGFLHLKIAQCYLSLKERRQAITFFYKSLHTMEDNVDARLTLASLLLEEQKEDEVITLLSPPKEVSTTDTSSVQPKPWWSNGKVKMQLAKIYHARGMLEDFVETILSSVRETLFIESSNQKVPSRKRLSKSILSERVKVLDDHQTDNVFSGFRPLAAPSELLKATRARKSLQKKAAMKEEKKAAVIAAGLDWHSEDSDEESPQQALKEPPLPKLLKEDEHYQLILDLCKALGSLRRYWDALEIINHSLRLADNTLPLEKKEELRSLGAQIAYNTTDSTSGYDCARSIVQQHPHSFAAWNCYYKVISRLESRLSKHDKFLRNMRFTHTEYVPPMIIYGHQLTMISQHQAAAREYLEAYKLQPDNSLINLCVGTALINLALGFRLQNKHQCVAQGFAFLFNNFRLCENSQEALYNIARACQHVGLVTLAVSYYEKVLAMHEKDYPIPKLPNENSSIPETMKSGHCDLRREAAYNLHLIYKKSGALDLARQVLKDHCTP